MNVKTVVPLATAVVLGLVAAVVARKMILQQPQLNAEGQPAVDMAEVLVAARDIPPGSKIGEGDLRVARMERDAVNDNMYTPATGGTLGGRIARVNVVRGQPMIDAMLAPQGAQAGLQGVIRQGMRAITVNVDEGIAAFLDPGNVVDVVGRLPGENGQGQMSVTIVQGVEVLAVGNRLTPERPDAKKPGEGEAPASIPNKAVTLLVTPEQAERIDLATVQGTPRLIMRSATDRENVETGGVRSTELAVPASSGQSPSTQPTAGIFDTAVHAPRRGEQRTREITVIRAGVVQKIEVNEGLPGTIQTLAAPTTAPTQPKAADPGAMTTVPIEPAD